MINSFFAKTTIVAFVHEVVAQCSNLGYIDEAKGQKFMAVVRMTATVCPRYCANGLLTGQGYEGPGVSRKVGWWTKSDRPR